MSNSFQELTNDFIKRVEALQVRKRNRNPKAQQSFEHAIRTIITDLWKATHCIPLRECLINKRSGYYSESKRYRDPLLTYNQTMAAFDGLLMLGCLAPYIRPVNFGFSNNVSGTGGFMFNA